MSNRGPKAKEIRLLKADALRRRMEFLGLTEERVAELCHLDSRDAVTKWRAGKSWPYPGGEQFLEKALEATQGFFSRIAEGISYKDALKDLSSEEEEPEPMAATLYRQFTEIYDTDIDEAPEVLFAREHLRLLGEYVNLVHKVIVRQKTDDFTKKRQSRAVTKNDKSGETGSETL